jgi:predicted Zn-dependent peptidase
MPLIRREDGSLIEGSSALRNVLISAASFAALLVSGCSVKPGFNLTPTEPSPVSGAALRGLVHGGQQPIVGAHVYLLAANTTGYGDASVSLLTSGPGRSVDGSGNYYVTTGSGGIFNISGDYDTCPASNTQVYLYSVGGNPGLGSANAAAGLMAALGTCGNLTTTENIVVNEVSTIATAYAIAGFATDALHVSSSNSALAELGIQDDLKPVGRDDAKLADLKKAFLAAQADAEQYVVPNQFTEVAEANGAHDLNAETGLDDTQYFWSMPENRLELWAWLESNRLADTVPREFYKERDVVMEERRMRVDSDPIGRLIEQFIATAYVAHNYGRSSIGWPSEVAQINATEAMAFHRKYYIGGNVVVSVVGDVDAKTAMPMLEKYFSRVPGGPKPEDMTTIEPRQFAEKSVVIREQTQPFFIEGYHRPSYHDPDDAVYDAISDIMSNGRVSRLYRSLVEQQQIAAEAEGFSPFPGEKYPSLFAFYAVPLPGHTPAEMRDAIHKEIEKLKTSDVTDAELQMYKTRTRADLLRGLADNQGLANSLAEYQTRYGDWRELFLQLDRVDKVTKADIRRVANQVFVPSNRTSAEIDTEPATPTAKNDGGAE